MESSSTAQRGSAFSSNAWKMSKSLQCHLPRVWWAMRQLQMHTRIRQRASVRERFKLLSPVQVAALPHKLSLDC